MQKKIKSIFAPERSVEECLRLWPTVAYRARPGTHKEFAAKIMHQRARREWEPGSAQLAFMRKLVDIYVPDNVAIDPDFIADMAEKTGWTVGQAPHPSTGMAPEAPPALSGASLHPAPQAQGRADPAAV